LLLRGVGEFGGEVVVDGWVGEDVVEDVVEGAAGGFGARADEGYGFLEDAVRGLVGLGQVGVDDCFEDCVVVACG
jgi:hypothetical protein